jgi:hypothetical protein
LTDVFRARHDRRIGPLTVAESDSDDGRRTPNWNIEYSLSGNLFATTSAKAPVQLLQTGHS